MTPVLRRTARRPRRPHPGRPGRLVPMAPFVDHRLLLGAGRLRVPPGRRLRAGSVAVALLAGLAAAGRAEAAQVTVVPAAQVPGQPVETSGSGFPAGAQGTVR